MTPPSRSPYAYHARLEILDVGDSDEHPIRSRYFVQPILLPVEPVAGDTIIIGTGEYTVLGRRLQHADPAVTVLFSTGEGYGPHDVGSVIAAARADGFTEAAPTQQEAARVVPFGRPAD